MKRIEAIISNEKVLELNEALKKAGVGGCTIFESRGRGKGAKPVVEGSSTVDPCLRGVSLLLRMDFFGRLNFFCTGYIPIP